MQYLQGWNCRMPGKYKTLIMDIRREIGRGEDRHPGWQGCWKGSGHATTKAARSRPGGCAVWGGRILSRQRVRVGALARTLKAIRGTAPLHRGSGKLLTTSGPMSRQRPRAAATAGCKT